MFVKLDIHNTIFCALGFNCTVLAYGQTGSGKTFTMGTEETTASVSKDTRGIIPRLVDAIFKQISESDMETNFKVCSLVLIFRSVLLSRKGLRAMIMKE